MNALEFIQSSHGTKRLYTFKRGDYALVTADTDGPIIFALLNYLNKSF